MHGFVAPTDHGWYQFLRARPELDEVNFWRPGGKMFRSLSAGEPFFFKLKAPYTAIGGFGIFAGFAQLPVWRAWDVFGQANGTADEFELRARLARLAHDPGGAFEPDRIIGCISILEPVFFPPDEWVRPPSDWARNIVSGRSYDLTNGEGERLWEACLERAPVSTSTVWVQEANEAARLGRPYVLRPRLGQRSFRLAVMEAYRGSCAVTTEHSLPVLEAAHIKPFHSMGPHVVQNGLALRRDLHRLFDLGFVTVRPDYSFAVSKELRDTYANGRTYYAYDGQPIALPDDPRDHPSQELLDWHGAEVFRA